MDRSWSSAKLFTMQSYINNANGDVPLIVENVWCFSFSLRSRCAHVLFERKEKNDYSLSLQNCIFTEFPV